LGQPLADGLLVVWVDVVGFACVDGHGHARILLGIQHLEKRLLHERPTADRLGRLGLHAHEIGQLHE
jgi:hypothetical protein